MDNWNDQRVLDAIEDVADDWVKQLPDPRYPTRVQRFGIVDGVEIKVVVDTSIDEIITGYPYPIPP